MKSLLIIPILLITSCQIGTGSPQKTEQHVIDSVVYVKQPSGTPPTFTREYWKFRAGGHWSISNHEMHIGDTVKMVAPR